MDEETNENLTPEEEEIVQDDNVSGEEAHRIEEYRVLRDLLESVRDDVVSLRDDIRGYQDDIRARLQEADAEAIENGAIITDVDDGGDADVIEGIDAVLDYDDVTPDLNDLDLKL